MVIPDIAVSGEAVKGLLDLAHRIIPSESYLRAELDKEQRGQAGDLHLPAMEKERKSRCPPLSGTEVCRPGVR